MDWLDLLAVQGTLNSLLQHHSSKASILQCSAFFIVQLSHSYVTTGNTVGSVQSLSRVLLLVTPWTVAHQAPLSMGLSRQEYWSGLPCPPPGGLLEPGMEPASLMSPALQAGSPGKPQPPSNHWLLVALSGVTTRNILKHWKVDPS